MRAVGYFRENSKDVPVAEQSRTFLEFCRGNGYEAAAVFMDAPRSPDDAPGFHQMVDFLRDQQPQGFILVAVPGLQSLGRDLVHSARRYFQLSGLGVQVVSIDGNTDLGSELLKQWGTSRHNGRLGEKVRAAMRQKAVKGEALGRPPYGYRVGPRGRLQIVADEGSVVRYIFRLYLKDGLGIRRIARRLNEEGLRTRRGLMWSMVTVRDLLRNRAYLGTYSRFGVRVPASHPPLISPQDFQRVQERLDQRRPKSSARETTRFLLSGIAYCGYCGNKMIGVTRRQRWRRRSDGEERTAVYRYYQCESRTNRSLCDYHTRRADVLEDEVRHRVLDGGSEVRPVAEPGPTLGAQDKQVRSKLRRLDRQLEQYLDAAAMGRIDEERMRTLSLQVAGEQLLAEEALVERERQVKRRVSDAERRRRRRDVLDTVRQRWDELTFPERYDLLRDILERVVVRDDGVEVHPRP